MVPLDPLDDLSPLLVSFGFLRTHRHARTSRRWASDRVDEGVVGVLTGHEPVGSASGCEGDVDVAVAIYELMI